MENNNSVLLISDFEIVGSYSWARTMQIFIFKN